jgi:hypothetical protein
MTDTPALHPMTDDLLHRECAYRADYTSPAQHDRECQHDGAEAPPMTDTTIAEWLRMHGVDAPAQVAATLSGSTPRQVADWYLRHTPQRVTEYAVFQRRDLGGWRMIASQSFYSDRWYGDGDAALTGIDAAWRATRRMRDNDGGEYTVKAVRTFVRAAR